ncbi:MAG: sigma-70 family RNA polymerase sigma factor [Acidobacteriia bacterium]|nr:sigma-70 family RNA polymerase sigma factor [Terriglobia bacterium]
MSTSSKQTPAERLMRSSDERLVRECLNGNQDAWTAIIGKYRRLIYSIPIRYGLSPTDAGDIFQDVCVQLVEALPTLREPKSLPAWLMRVTAHGCSRWAGRERRFQPIEYNAESGDGPVAGEMPDDFLQELERSQILREAMLQIPPRCRELIRMLFFETPALPYDEVAKRLGLAKGSIGFIRMRCLARLRKQLEKRGFV